MRDTTGLDPMWESGERSEAGSRLVRALGSVVRGAGKRIAPRVLSWASAQRPRLSLAWGRKVVHVRGDGVVTTRREGEGWGDNPRRNYNEAVQKRQERAAATPPEEPAPEVVAPLEAAPEPEAPVDLSLSALEAAVQKTMGLDQPSEGSEGAAEVSRDPDVLKAQLVGVRSLLQALDDVDDWDLVEAVDEDLYQLHKAVEYKLRNHKASEAKAQLNDLFK